MESMPLFGAPAISDAFTAEGQVIVHTGDALGFLKRLPDDLATLVINSPPYNLGKEYERRQGVRDYLDSLTPVLAELVRVLAPDGSLCWEVGNYVDGGEIIPLDVLYYPILERLGLRMRNRIVWSFGHGLHASRRFSGRYEVIMWMTKSGDYKFNLDAVRVPAKYPGKTHFKGPNKGKPSGNPMGKNPSDVWQFVQDDWERGIWDIPNVKANHPEKTIHPCQFPVELVERCVLALTDEDDWVLDPYVGVGSALLAGLMHNRRVIGCDKESSYTAIARQRIANLYSGTLKTRKVGTPVYQPTGREKVSRLPLSWVARDRKRRRD
ncbi:site-specific DNA-methyltransferase [candidate division WOR-3 bacterium]|nr:site-specific DNA-methyltransferase [candidate division WOR-3 bacterium]